MGPTEPSYIRLRYLKSGTTGPTLFPFFIGLKSCSSARHVLLSGRLTNYNLFSPHSGPVKIKLENADITPKADRYPDLSSA